MTDDPGFLFPLGLKQSGDARCSVDALLLASFAQGNALAAVDFGTGCGVVGLGLLLRGVAKTVDGVDIDPEQAATAAHNARLLGFGEAFTARTLDVHAMPEPVSPAGLVVCNPPWRRRSAERLPASARRQMALFGSDDTFPAFTRAAALCLGRGGVFAAVIGAERMPDMLEAMKLAGLTPCRLRMVHSRRDRQAVFALVEGRKSVHCAFMVEPSLVLHKDRSDSYTDEARQFCLWLHA